MDRPTFMHGVAGNPASTTALGTNDAVSTYILKTYDYAIERNNAILTSFIGETLQWPTNRGKEIQEEFYLPVASDKNISVAGLGNNWNEEAGMFDNGTSTDLGLQNGEPLRKKYFTYYFGGRQWEVKSSKQISEANATFVKPEVVNTTDTGSSITTQFDLSSSDDITALKNLFADSQNGGYQLDDDLGYLGLRAVILPLEDVRQDKTTQDNSEKQYSITILGNVPINRKYTITINRTSYSYTTKTGDTAKSVADYFHKEIVLGGKDDGDSAVFDKQQSTVTSENNSNDPNVNHTLKLVPKSEDERLDDYEVKVNNTNLMTTKVEKEWDGDTSDQRIVIHFYTINPVDRLSEAVIDLSTMLPLEAVYPLTDYEADKRKITAILEENFVDIYFSDAVKYAINHGLITEPFNVDDEWTVPIAVAKKAQDTIRVLDFRRNYSDNPDDYHPDNFIEGTNKYDPRYAGKGRKYFAYNLSDIVAMDFTEQIFCVFADSPVSNMGGESLDYSKVLNYLPIISENTGQANSVGFSRFKRNASLYEMGMMFKFTKDILLFSDWGSRSDKGKRTFNPEPLVAMIDAFTKEVHRQRDLALQIELINGAGLSFYPEGSMTVSSINKPLKASDLDRAYATLIENGAEYDNDLVKADNTYGGVGIDKSYTIICPPEVVRTFRHITSGIVGDEVGTFKSAVKYSANAGDVSSQIKTDNPFVYEVGSLAGFRIIQAPSKWLIYYQGGGAVPPSNMYFDRAMNIYYSPTPETIQEKGLERVKDAFRTTGGRLDIYLSFVVGKGSAKVLSLKQGDYQRYVDMPKPKNNDPFGKQGFVSTSWWFGVLISHNNRIMKIHCPVLN